MALFKPFSGNRANLASVALVEGHAYFCLDDGSFHIDAKVNGTLKRIQVNAQDANTLEGKSYSDIQSWVNTQIANKKYTISASATDDDIIVLTGTAGSNGVSYDAKHAKKGPTSGYTSGNTTTSISGSGGSGTIKIPQVTVDAYGHVTAAADESVTITLPTIPTVNNATLTIQKNGTTVDTFTANSATNKTVNITVPTGAAADKGVDTSISAASTSTNLPTSKAVAAFVEGKGYKTTDNNTTYDLAASASSTNGNVKINLTAGGSGTGTDSVTIKGTGGASVTTDAKGVVSISAPAKITVDTALSSTSTNPVQNKVVNAAIAAKSSVSVANAATSGNKIADITINGTATTLYAPTQTSVSGNAGTATKFSSARKIELTGDVTGSATADGSSGWSITATVADDSHNHVISNIDGLQDALDSKPTFALDNGKIPSNLLPAYVDDVLEYDTYNSLPATGETGKIYVTKDTNKTWRWGGSAYVEISASLALGSTASTAAKGNHTHSFSDDFNATGKFTPSGSVSQPSFLNGSAAATSTTKVTAGSGSHTHSGTVAAQSFTVAPAASGDVTYTPAGTISAPTVTVTLKSSSAAAAAQAHTHSASYTPAGTISEVVTDISTDSADVAAQSHTHSVSGTVSKPTFTGSAGTTGMISAEGASSDTEPTTGVTEVLSGASAALSSTPSFTGSAVTSGKNSGTGVSVIATVTHTAASLGTASTSSAAPGGHTHTVTVNGTTGNNSGTAVSAVNASVSGETLTLSAVTAAPHTHTHSYGSSTALTTSANSGTNFNAVTGYNSFSGGSISKTTATVAPNEHTHSVTAAGTVSKPSITVTPTKVKVASSKHKHSFTPSGSVSQPTFSNGSAFGTSTTKVTAITSVTPTSAAPTFTGTAATISVAKTGATGVTVVTGVKSATATAPTFTGTGVRLVGSTAAATVTTGGPSATVDAAAQGHTHTVSGTVSKPTFTGTEGTVTVSGSVSGTTGTPA